MKVLPGHAHRTGAVEGEQEDSGAQPGGRVVLIIDDENVVAQATAMLLEVMGYEVVLAASFDEAQAWFATERQVPDMILCDFHLAAGEKGGETIERIRSMAGCNMPAVLVTGDTSEAIAAACREIEDCHLLGKPVDGDELLEVMRRLL